MGRIKKAAIKRRNSGGEGRTIATLISMVHRHKKKMANDLLTPLWRRMLNNFFLILAVRWLSVFLVSTEFVPDEAWQSTEVAYRFTFGRGHLTWEWIFGLRNHIYPLCISGIYSLLQYFECVSPYSLIVAPRLFQGTITAFGDYAFFLYCIRRNGIKSAKWSLGCVLTCWFTFYCGSRTITNSTEMALNCIAMYLLDTEQIVAMVGVVGLNFIIRPTAVVIWIPQALTIFRHFFPRTVQYRIPASLFVGLGIVILGGLVDCFVYQRPTVTWCRFLQFNFLDGHSAQFGTHHVLWYFYCAIPSIVLFNVAALGLSLYLRLHQQEWKIILGYLFCFSLVSHKEIRFLLPVMPYVFIVMGDIMYRCAEFSKEYEQDVFKMENVNIRRFFLNGVMLCCAIHFLTGSYFCGFHQGAVLPTTEFVNNASKTMKNPQIWVMMSCYAVPVFTYMHNPKADFEYMTCGPGDIGLNDTLPNFRRYSTNMTLLKEFVQEKTLTLKQPYPDFVLCFDEVVGKLMHVFRELDKDYFLCYSHIHAQFGDDRGMVNVLCRKGVVPEPPEPSQKNDSFL